MKVLFVVCGEGLGHASRCLHLGHCLQRLGHAIHFAGYGKSYDFMNQHGCTNLHNTPREVSLEGNDGFFSLKKTLWHSKWIAFDMVRSMISVRRLIRKNAFDCLVCDTMFGGLFAARFEKVPCVFITNQNHFNGLHGKTNPVWKVLNFGIRRYLHLADHVIVPDYPPPETVSEYNVEIPEGRKDRYSFTGPFLDVDPSRYTYDTTTIFTSFGGEPYKLPMYQMLRRIADSRPDMIFDVFYTGPRIPDSSANFLSHAYVPNLYEHLAKAKIAIVHGGLTTLHEALLFEKPVLIIMDPGHPEQQNNAQKITDMGAGISVNGKTVTQDVLEAKIMEALQLKPKPFRAGHATINGRKNAAEIITRIARRGQSS